VKHDHQSTVITMEDITEADIEQLQQIVEMFNQQNGKSIV